MQLNTSKTERVFSQYTPAVVLTLHNESIWHENESRRKKDSKGLTVLNYPFHNLRVNTQPITFYARFFLGGQSIAGNCEISNIPTLSSSMAAVKAKKLYLSPLICV